MVIMEILVSDFLDWIWSLPVASVWFWKLASPRLSFLNYKMNVIIVPISKACWKDSYP